MSWAEVKNLKDYIDSKVKVSTDCVGVSKIFVPKVETEVETEIS